MNIDWECLVASVERGDQRWSTSSPYSTSGTVGGTRIMLTAVNSWPLRWGRGYFNTDNDYLSAEVPWRYAGRLGAALHRNYRDVSAEPFATDIATLCPKGAPK